MAAFAHLAAAVLSDFQQRYRAARQRRALATLSLSGLKDLGYPTIEDLDRRRGSARRAV
jgi:hypothetical protein